MLLWDFYFLNLHENIREAILYLCRKFIQVHFNSFYNSLRKPKKQQPLQIEITICSSQIFKILFMKYVVFNSATVTQLIKLSLYRYFVN